MLLNQTSEEFRISFLKAFTRKLIENTSPEEVFRLKELVHEKEEDRKRSIKHEKDKERQIIKDVLKGNLSERKLFPDMPKRPSNALPPQKREIRIPRTRLPPHLQYLKPTSSEKKDELDLGRLNNIIKDPLVRDIQVDGPDEKIRIHTTRGEKILNMVLSKEEIDEVIDKFSTASHIPKHDGLYRIAYGKLVLNAIISEITGSRFILKKLSYKWF